MNITVEVWQRFLELFRQQQTASIVFVRTVAVTSLAGYEDNFLLRVC